MICGYYQMAPATVGALTPVEIRTMLEGIDWVSDRDWERAIFLRTNDPRAMRDILDYSYPHFRTDRVVKIIRPPDADEPPIPKRRGFRG